MEQPTLETWDMKMHRLALELKDIRESSSATPKELADRGKAFQRKKYEIDLHLATVEP